MKNDNTYNKTNSVNKVNLGRSNKNKKENLGRSNKVKKNIGHSDIFIKRSDNSSNFKLNKGKSNKRYSKKRIFRQRPISIFYYIPLILIIVVVPLIVQGKQIDLTGTLQSLFWNGDIKYIDFFSYFKSIVFVVLTFLLVINFIKLLFRKRIILKNESKYYIPMFIYIFFVILSTTLAVDKSTALIGFVDMYQGIYVLICYIFIMFCCINMVKTRRDINIVASCFIVLIVFEGIVGLTQFVGKDIFQTSLFNKLIMMFENNLLGKLNFENENRVIYGTLFNCNFVGSFAILFLPISLVISFSTKSIKKKVSSILALFFIIVLIIGCKSRTCYACVALSLILTIIIFRRRLFCSVKRKIIVFTSTIIVFLVLVLLYSKLITDYKLYVNDLLEFYDSQNNDKRLIFNNVILGKDVVEIDTNKEYIKFVIRENGISILDRENNILPVKKVDNNFSCIDKKGYGYVLFNYRNDYPIFSVKTRWKIHGILNFYKSNDGIKIISGCGRLTEPHVAKTITQYKVFNNLFTGRGFIWNRTIPLLKDHIFIGAGPDNFVYRFPQNDYVSKMNNRYNVNIIFDKPHNMYLQYAMNTGVLSLLAMLIIFIIYIVQSLKIYWNMKFNSFSKCFGASCFISVVGYLAIGVINDQIISVAPLFYIILGIGISINHVYLNSKNNLLT